MSCGVIVSTSPGRQQHLKACLNGLVRQTLEPSEVLIVDDGSEGMQEVLSEFEPVLPLQYLWRSNDGNLSKSRNMGAQASKATYLVFVNTDIGLNPQALAAYVNMMKATPQATLWGYVGCRKSVVSPSIWDSQTQVNWLDFRFFPLTPNRLFIDPGLQHTPYNQASGHHFAMTRAAYENIGPMDESFTLWGEEDVEFALRGLLKGHPMIFLGDAWAEHVVHDYSEKFHTAANQELRHKAEVVCALEDQLRSQPPDQMMQVVFQNAAAFYQLMQRHYLPFAPRALNDFEKYFYS